MSNCNSQDALYKDKCLYAAFNILLAKIQRLETDVQKLKSANNSSSNSNSNPNSSRSNSSWSSNDPNSITRRIDRLELKVNEQNKNTSGNQLTSNLDDYLKDMDDIMEFQIQTVPDLPKLT